MMKIIKNLINRFLGIFGFKISNLDSGLPLFPIESTLKEQELINKYLKFSMTNETRMWSLLKSLEYILNKKIDGDVLECGVWKGGCIGLMDEYLRINNSKKKIYAYDTYDGMSIPSEYDIDFRGIQITEMVINEYENIYGYPKKNEVISNLKILGSKLDKIKFIEGMVEKTLMDKKNIPEKISLMRLDTDFYQSTRTELEILYPLLSKGGILIIDDYGHFEGARKAVDEYFKEKKPLMHYIDYTCRLIQKV